MTRTLHRRALLALASLAVIATPAVVVAQGGVQGARPAPGPAGGWRYIGTTTARRSADRDAIAVRGNDSFRRLKFSIRDAPLRIHRVRVTYDDGTRDDLPMRVEIPRGGESRAIDLNAPGRRSLRRIEFWYDTRGWGRSRADVSVYGMR
jgi:hypothetical protein